MAPTADRYVYLPLPWMTRQSGRPSFARIPLRFGVADDSELTIPERAFVVVLKVPPAQIIAYMPDKVPGGDCYEKADPMGRAKADVGWQVWVDRFLVESIESPEPSMGWVQEMGPDRDTIVNALLRYWSWVPDQDGRYPYMPNGVVQQILRAMSKRSGLMPSDLLMRPLDAFTLDSRVLRVVDRRPAIDDDEELEPSPGILAGEYDPNSPVFNPTMVDRAGG